MKLQYLFPNRFKKIGWIILIPSVVLGVYWLIEHPEPDFLDVTIPPFLIEESFLNSAKDNLLNEVIGLLLIISSFLVAFSKEKLEDEFINKIRLDSLVWATYFNYTILALSIIFIYNSGFLNIMAINLFTILIFFIIRFNWVLYKMKRS